MASVDSFATSQTSVARSGVVTAAPSIEKARTPSQTRSWSSVHLDALRGCAALVVVAGHERGLFFPAVTASSTVAPPENPGLVPASNGVSIGDEAVMVFFVLSGYLVGGSVVKAFAKQNWSWKDYLLRRLTRLWTVLIPALLLGLVIDFTGMHFLGGAGSIYDAPVGQDFVLSSRFSDIWNLRIFFGNMTFLQTIFTPLAGTNMALWSLCYEFWYYIAFPLLMFALSSRLRPATRLACAGAVGAILWLVGAHAALLSLVWLLGVAVYLAPRKLSAKASRAATLAAPLLLAATFLLVKKYIQHEYIAEFTVAFIFAPLLYALLHRSAQASSGLYPAAAQFLSQISYTLYLTHLPMLIFLCAIFNRLFDRPWRLEGVSSGSLAIFSFMLAAALFYAWLLYLAFESKTDRIRAALAERLN